MGDAGCTGESEYALTREMQSQQTVEVLYACWLFLLETVQIECFKFSAVAQSMPSAALRCVPAHFVSILVPSECDTICLGNCDSNRHKRVAQ